MSVKFTLDANAGGAVKAVGDLNKALDETEKKGEAAVRKTRDLGSSMQDAGKKGHESFGQHIVGDIAKMTAGFLTLEHAIDVVKDAFVDAAEQAKKASEASISALSGLATIEQAPGNRNANLALARRLQAGGVTKDFGQAADVVAGLRRGQVGDANINALVQAVESKQISPTDVVGIGTAVQKISEVTGGDFAGTLGKLQRAARVSRATLGEEAAGAQGVTARGQRLGFGFEESLGALAALSKTAASPEEARRQLQALYSSIGRRGLGAGNLGDTLLSIGGAEQRGVSMKDLLGSDRAALGFRGIHENMGVFWEQREALRAARGGGGRPLSESDAVLRTGNLAEQRQAQLASANERVNARRASLFSAMSSEMDTAGLNRGEWAIARAARHIDQGLMLSQQQQNTALANILDPSSSARQVNQFTPSQQLQTEIRDYLKGIHFHTSVLNTKQNARAVTRAE